MDPRLPQLDYASAGTATDWKQTQAARADVLKCYEEAVQEPMLECTNLDSFYCGAQQDGSPVPEARLLREDFCSTAIVARTWLNLHEENLSQGVDIDLDALRDTRRRIFREGNEVREKLRLKLVQSPAFAGSPLGAELPEGDVAMTRAEVVEGQTSESAAVSEDGDTKTASSWNMGAATDRFERRYQARLAKGNAKGKQKATFPSSTTTQAAGRESRLMLLHSDVLDLPFSYTTGTAPKSGESQSTVEERRVEAPDMIAALNYALCYFHSRAALLAYLRICLRTLKPATGVLVCDLFGGPPTGEAYPDQESTWRKFEQEPGFTRKGDRLRAEEAGGDEGALRPLWGSETVHRRQPDQTRPNGLAHEHGFLEDFGEVRVVPPPPDAHLNTCAEWPKGKLKMVRTGEASGGFEYWREDGPIDYRTNRFRMSLSFRFEDRQYYQMPLTCELQADSSLFQARG